MRWLKAVAGEACLFLYLRVEKEAVVETLLAKRALRVAVVLVGVVLVVMMIVGVAVVVVVLQTLGSRLVSQKNRRPHCGPVVEEHGQRSRRCG